MRTKDNYTQKDVIVNAVQEYLAQEEKKVKHQVVDTNFEITHKKDLIELFEFCGSSNALVLAHIYNNVMMSCMLYFGSIDTTSKATGVSRSSVKRAFNELQDRDKIRMYLRGVWAVNPKTLRKCTGGKYIALLRFYYSLPRKGEER